MKELKLNEFVDKLASKEPVPGGGSVAAVCGALGAALAEMVANLTLGKKKYGDVEPEMKKIIEKTALLRNKLLDDIQKDSFAYDKVIEAYKLPKGTDGEISYRLNKIEENLKAAALIPYEIAETAIEIMPLCEAVVERGNSNAISDGLVGAMMARTAVLSALYNVKINLASIRDQEFVEVMSQKTADIEQRAVEYEKRILNKSPF
jgi:formiminotetrahydrofolate cyclodeaminase